MRLRSAHIARRTRTLPDRQKTEAKTIARPNRTLRPFILPSSVGPFLRPPSTISIRSHDCDASTFARQQSRRKPCSRSAVDMPKARSLTCRRGISEQAERRWPGSQPAVARNRSCELPGALNRHHPSGELAGDRGQAMTSCRPHKCQAGAAPHSAQTLSTSAASCKKALRSGEGASCQESALRSRRKLPWAHPESCPKPDRCCVATPFSASILTTRITTSSRPRTSTGAARPLPHCRLPRGHTTPAPHAAKITFLSRAQGVSKHSFRPLCASVISRLAAPIVCPDRSPKVSYDHMIGACKRLLCSDFACKEARLAARAP